ncbi:hypothetical protein HDU76_012398, partial [Blyttiomyces sp. JEL0837]
MTSTFVPLGGKSESTPPALQPGPSTNHDGEDMAKIQDYNCTEGEITQSLLQRFTQDVLYTRVGPSTLIAMNPFSESPRIKDTDKTKPGSYDLENVCDKGVAPHPYEIAATAYLHMTRAMEDQAILTSGESGSGKSETLRQVLQHIVFLSQQTDPEASVHKEVLSADVILECFGNAQVEQNRNSTRYSRYTEVKFNDEGTITGQKIVDYLFEHTRVSSFPDNERNFHIFYILLASLSKEERHKLGLQNDPKHYEFLNNGRGPINPISVNEMPSLESLRASFRTLGFTKKIQNEIFQVLSGILHLGNIEFTEENTKKGDGAFVKNRNVLEKTAELLNVNPDRLESAITTSTLLSGDTVCSTFLDIPKSIEARNQMGAVLYQVLFKWIIEQINSHLGTSRLGGENFVTQIGLLDIAGFEDKTPRPNKFDQFMSNYANEKLQTFVLQRGINAIPDNLLLDGVQLSEVPPPPVNLGRIHLYEDPKNGFFHLIDRETHRGLENGLDSTLLATLQDAHSELSSQYYEPGPPSWSTFKIKHYTGKSVSYDITGFIAKNRNSLFSEVLNLFGVTKVSSSGRQRSRNFIAGLFTDAVVEPVVHPRDNASMVSARPAAPKKPSNMNDRPIDPSKKKSTMLLSSPALAGAGATTEEDKGGLTSSKDHLSISGYSVTSLSQLRVAIDELLEAVNGMRTWTILCLKPNADFIPKRFDERRVREQVQALRIKEMVQAAKSEFSVGIEFNDFAERYIRKQDGGDDTTPTPRSKCEAFVQQIGWGEGDFRFGNTRLFLTERYWRTLESERDRQDGTESEERRIHVPASGTAKATRKSQMSLATVKGSRPGLDGGTGNKLDDLEKGFVIQPATSGNTLKDGDKGDDEDDDNDAKKKKRRCCGLLGEKEPPRPKQKMSRSRRTWVIFTWCVTWYIPDFLLIYIGKMKSEGVRMAWREKVALCFIVLFLSGIMLFFVVGFGRILCPVQSYFTAAEVAAHKDVSKHSLF